MTKGLRNTGTSQTQRCLVCKRFCSGNVICKACDKVLQDSKLPNDMARELPPRRNRRVQFEDE